MFIHGDSQSWEDTQLAEIANNHSLLNSFQTLKYVNVALLTILLYDYCLTFNLEKKRIWTLSWKLPKCLFMINRYILPPVLFFEGFSNAMNVGDNICHARIFTLIPALFALSTVELMLLLRVLALYGNSLRLARFLIIQFFAQLIACLLMGIISLSRTTSIAGHNIFTGCLSNLPNWAYLTWAPPLILECTLVILTIYKCRGYGEFTPTIKVLARDSIIYFISITSIIILNMFYIHHYKLIGEALSLPTCILTSIAATRLSMNIRAITVDHGIATLVPQGCLSTLFSLSGDSHNSSTVIPTQQEGTGLGEGYEENEGWCEGWNEEVIKIEHGQVCSSVDDVERVTCL